MKTLLALLTLLLALAIANAAPVTLAWDYDTDGVTYEVYRGIEKLATVSTKQAVVDVKAGDVLHVVAIGPLGFRSADSEKLTIVPAHFPPAAPTKLRVVIEGTITIYPATSDTP